MADRVSVIIVSCNTRELLRRCLESLASAGCEIIVVDNASTDGSEEMVAREHPGVTLIRNERNLMFAKANNQGLRQAHGEYLLMLNSDTVVPKGCIEGLVRFLEEHPGAGAVGPKVLNLDGSLQSKGHPLQSIRTTLVTSFGLRRWCDWPEDERRRVGWISGCCMLTRRGVVEQVGGLCEELSFYGEEVEWCWRVDKSGWEVWYEPASQVLHVGGGSTTTAIREDVMRPAVQLRNFRCVQLRTVGLARALVISLIMLAGNLVKGLVALVVRPSFAGKLFRQARWECTVCRHLICGD